MTDVTITRDAAQIAREINTIKEGVRETFLRASIEIGRRLHEAKSVVPYGEWGKWLEANVAYSESTAQNLMRIADEYGRKESQALADISYTQAVALLRLPAEEREQFVAEHDMQSMSTREMTDEIKRLNAEREKLQMTIEELLQGETSSGNAQPDAAEPITMVDESELKGVRDQLEEADRLFEEEHARANDLEKALISAREQVKETEKRREDDLRREQARAAEAEKKLEKAVAERNAAKKQAEADALKLKRTEEELQNARAQVRTVEVLPDSVQAELDALRQKASRTGAESEMRAAYDGLVAAFERLMDKLTAARELDAATADKFSAAFGNAMIKMAERVRG